MKDAVLSSIPEETTISHLQLRCRLILFLQCVALFNRATAFVFPSGRYQRYPRCIVLSATSRDDVEDDSTFACFIPKKFSREDGQRIMDETIMPSEEYDKRMVYGRDAQKLESSTIVKASDPRMAYTYGEFPFSSLDELVDLALTHSERCKGNKDIRLVDLGSGCGRLVLYSAMTRGKEDDVSWTVHGIEISDVLHDEGIRASLVGVDSGIFQEKSDNSVHSNQFFLHRGPAEDFASLFQQSDIVFAYSTVFDTVGFDPSLGAMVMNTEWNELLTCSPGAIVITTDRCLNPVYGWKLLDRLDVDNREVMGSTGYIHIFQP